MGDPDKDGDRDPTYTGRDMGPVTVRDYPKSAADTDRDEDLANMKRPGTRRMFGRDTSNRTLRDRSGR